MSPDKVKAITKIKGLCAPMMINDIDTDIITPAQYLTQTSKSGYGQHAFSRLKQTDHEFVLNKARFQQALASFGLRSAAAQRADVEGPAVQHGMQRRVVDFGIVGQHSDRGGLIEL